MIDTGTSHEAKYLKALQCLKHEASTYYVEQETQNAQTQQTNTNVHALYKQINTGWGYRLGALSETQVHMGFKRLMLTFSSLIWYAKQNKTVSIFHFSYNENKPSRRISSDGCHMTDFDLKLKFWFAIKFGDMFLHKI